MLYICVIRITYCSELDTNYSISIVAGLIFIVKSSGDRKACVIVCIRFLHILNQWCVFVVSGYKLLYSLN